MPLLFSVKGVNEMWYEFLIEGLKKFAGEIIGLILIAVFFWKFPKLKDFVDQWNPNNPNRVKPVDTQKADEIQRQLEIEREEEALRQAEAQKAEEAKRREEIQRQLEKERWKHKQPHARKFVVAAVVIIAVVAGIVFQQHTRTTTQPVVIEPVTSTTKQPVTKPAMSDEDFLELCKSGDAKRVEEAIKNGVGIKANGGGVLMWATRYGRTETVEVLLKYGADVNYKNYFGWTALILAAGDGYTETAEVLLKYGADVNYKLNDGWTALMFAAENGYTETAEVLLKYGANVNAKNNYGNTALMLAKNEEVRNLLRRYGAK